MSTTPLKLPLFPLKTVLYPGGQLPLKVFEQRYLEMTKRCLRDDTVFGVCLIREGHEVGEPALPAGIGCTARIAQWELPHPNLFHLLAVGERRFRVLRSEVESLGLITCDAELLDASPPPVTAPDEVCRKVLQALIDRIGVERFPAPLRLDDAEWVSYRLAETLPFDLESRQLLLEAGDTAARQELLRRVLDEATPRA